MRFTFDSRNKVAYLLFRDRQSARTVNPKEPAMQDRVLFDFDKDGHLVGMEFLDPLRTLGGETIDELEAAFKPERGSRRPPDSPTKATGE